MTDPNPVFALRVLECDHTECEFTELGRRTWPTETEQAAEYQALPDIEPDPNADLEYVIDVLDADGAIINGKLITTETVETFLGATIDGLRERSAG